MTTSNLLMLLDRQIGRLLTFENPTHIASQGAR